MSSYGAKKSNYLDDYVSVASRLEGFHEKYPNGRIITNLIEREDGLICFKAYVYTEVDSAEPSATGHSIDSLDIKSSSFEKLETAAVGRALAFLGFGAKNISSAEEMERHESRQAQQPRAAQQRQGVPVVDLNAKPSTEQVAEIKQLRLRLKINSPLDFSKLTYSTAEDALVELRELAAGR